MWNDKELAFFGSINTSRVQKEYELSIPFRVQKRLNEIFVYDEKSFDGWESSKFLEVAFQYHDIRTEADAVST